jgi:mRNA interferase HigB
VPVHVISRKLLRDFWSQHPEAEVHLAAWFKVAEAATWASWTDVQRAYPRASYYRCCLVFNILGGNYRLVVRRGANWKTLFIVGVFTHAEYDRDHWKAHCTCR